MSELPGFGEARMVGIFGKTGSGKSILAAYLIAGFSRNPQLGILVIDPQGEFARNFPGSKMPEGKFDFHGLLKAMRGPFKIYTLENVGLDNNDYETFVRLLKKSGILSDFGIRDELKQDDAGLSLIYDLKQSNKNVTDISFDDLQNNIREILQHLYRRSYLERNVLPTFNIAVKYNKDRIESKLNIIKSLFGRPIKIDDIIKDVVNNHEVIILDISKAGSIARHFGLEEIEIKALILDKIIDKLRQSGEELFYRGLSANVLVVLDEAHRYVPNTLPKNEELARLLRRIRDSVRTTRKYGIGWMFITQSIADFDKEVYRQLHDYFFGYGLSVGADYQHIKEVTPKESLEVYRSLPDPKRTGQYVFMHTGSFSMLSTVASATFVKVFSIKEFIKYNLNMDYDEFLQKYGEEAIKRRLEKRVD